MRESENKRGERAKQPFSYHSMYEMCIAVLLILLLFVVVAVLLLVLLLFYTFFAVHRSCYYLSMLVSTVKTLDVIVSLMNW